MKKLMLSLFLVGSLLLVMVGTASAYTIGHDIIERSQVDSYIDFTMIDLGLQFEDSGRISSWSLFAKNTGDVYLQTFRLDSGIYSIVGENFFSVSTLGANTFNVSAGDQIEFQAGDYIGWTFTNPAVFGFDYQGDTTLYTSNYGGAKGVGSGASFIGETLRTYSVAAGTVPVPEPSTLLLLGCGIAGLGFYARKRKKA